MLKNSIPNLLTLTNLSLGIISIVETFNNNYFYAAILIILAAIIDRYDGRIARFLNVSNNLGKELDSLADLVSFGVAPALLIFVKYYFFNLEYMGIIGIIIPLLYTISGCYRLAKYNLSEFDGVFTGIPITISGTFIAFFTLITPNNGIFIILSLMLLSLFTYLMVSKLRIKKV
ncbi:CDP-diacylglycerol--serine O-phosphatidyltransferase [Clostridium scatologenes]|uniref:CDP-diacylglycerol--serine O-phosphatidyltransferase n=1 Tax=Clostridium scatologenes TaxID=1548 RepID=A0A0E3GQ03_CLOSL|nr:CDP-diacylglycerol--serine O-phosphatidyltransferase [Clostridium scatologenes]AKA67721.1 putative CDP-diacylglycerol-serine O-phosphatidyltransferase [Clostridium scatologenes]